jgi:hypothetical protein
MEFDNDALLQDLNKVKELVALEQAGGADAAPQG